MSDIKRKNVKFIVCDVLYDEIKDRIPESWTTVNLEKRLHNNSKDLMNKLQDEINRSQEFDLIVLGYALCGKGVEGLVSEKIDMVILKCDDCISILLGSVDEYKKQFKIEPGTYYVTREYLGEVDNIILEGFKDIRFKYDDSTWKWVIGEMLKNYKRLAFINTGNYPVDEYRKKAKASADELNL
ncbi:MAG: DUF1638 domain-containing protein, partial [Actinobacteria bacterium]|nr:DUF1638 domain-containing protein [Actinomycetota bacterium]